MAMLEARACGKDQIVETLIASYRQYSKSNAEPLRARKPNEACLFCCWLLGWFLFLFWQMVPLVVLAILGLTM